MNLRLEEVTVKKQLADFIDFPASLYASSPFWVPDLRGGEFSTLGSDNPAKEFCNTILYLAYYGDTIVGRIAGIINHKANKKWNVQAVRFGWFDFIEDFEVAKSLIEAVTLWGKSRGMTKIIGPLGFTNLDKAGFLVDGFDKLSPFTCIYNHPYYCDYLEKLGFSKEYDWTQEMMILPERCPERIGRLSRIIEQRYGFHIYKPTTKKDLKEAGRKMLYLYNEAFINVYGATALTAEQIEDALDSYTPILNSEYICFVMDKEDNLAGFSLSVPSLSQAIRKAGGRLFPFGFIHILKSLVRNDTLEALLIGILPKYQGMGLNAFMMEHTFDSCKRHGITKVLMNPRLEDNKQAQRFFSNDFPLTSYGRRRCYSKIIFADSK